ncbi:MAG: hypothetical protein HKN43_03825 [Rhodothermales bacterium]|nr:hypothetical protein [Rhodothermales bacterium]
MLVLRSFSVLLAFWIVLLSSCQPPEPTESSLIERLTEHQGKHLLDRTHVSFNFRDKHFEVWRYDGLFRYSRGFADSTGRVLEVLDNSGVYRYENGNLVEQVEKRRNSIETDVNSVVYFALLPYQLTDPAVIPKYLGRTTVDGVSYETLEVTFMQANGGRDYEDRFVYWIHPEDDTIDYLAYFYHTDGGGSRFRKAVNRRRVGGVLFADYLNYRAEPDSIGSNVHLFSSLFNEGAVELVSEVILDSLRVEVPDSMPKVP